MDTSEGAAIVQVLAEVLDQLTRRNAQHERTHSQSAVTKFHALKPPQISVLAYLERIYKYASCSSECFVLALIYIDRLISKNNFLLTDLNGKFVSAWFSINLLQFVDLVSLPWNSSPSSYYGCYASCQIF